AGKVDAAVSGSADMSCRASRSNTAKTFGSGSISYTGNPSQVVTEGKHIYKK
ncbi:GIN domain-containing protein, partial [Phocaeicola plebeius]|uniref:GIN domain-containing protein n=1 Tax=Phocaeicola plebeius TaxID=310297 RepID=UPI004025AB69